MFMHDVAHLLMQSRRSVAAITSVITGTNFLTHLDHRLAHTFVSLRYTLPEIEEKSDEPRLTSRWQGGGAGSDLESALERLAGAFDLVLVDPYHDYADSIDVISAAIRLAGDDGMVLVHDCMPQRKYVADVFRPGPWAGMTFAAFRDLAPQTGREWFVVASEMGIGVLGPQVGAQPTAADLEWAALSKVAKVAAYVGDPRAVMNAVDIDAVPEALAALEGRAASQRATA